MIMSTYTVTYQQEPEGWYSVRVNELPWCVSYWDTFEDASNMIQEALELYIEATAEMEWKSIKTGKPFICKTTSFKTYIVVDYETV